MDETNIEMINKPSGPSAARENFLETKTIGISGMTCDDCVATIEQALRGKNGVEEVKVDRAAAQATVTYDKRRTNLPALHEILLRSGYHPTDGVVE